MVQAQGTKPQAMSRRKGRSQRGTWQQQQQRASLNHKAISLPPIDSRPFQLEFQLQIVLQHLQVPCASACGQVIISTVMAPTSPKAVGRTRVAQTDSFDRIGGVML